MKIFILAPEPPPPSVLHHLTSLGVEPTVAMVRAESMSESGVHYRHVTARGQSGDPLDLRWSRKALRAAIREVGPALLHIVGDPWTPTAEAGAAAARDLKLPYALVGTSSIGGPGGMTARWQAKRVREGAAALGGITRPALDHLVAGSTDRPVGVVPPGGITIPGTVRRHARATPTFAAAGRLIRERGIDLLLDALGSTYGTWQLKVIGTGPEQESLEAHAQRLGLSGRIEWLGAVPREALGTLWPAVDALIAPSRVTPSWVEPNGQVVLEAMAHGVAPMVSRSGALPDVAGDTGLVFDPEDVGALTAGLQQVVDSPDRAIAMGNAARLRVLERYGDVAIAERLVVLWRKALGTG